MMDEGFNDLVGGFMKKHCGEFDEGEENKLVYMQLFSEYTTRDLLILHTIFCS